MAQTNNLSDREVMVKTGWGCGSIAVQRNLVITRTLGPWKLPCYCRVKEKGDIKILNAQNFLIIRGFCHIRTLYSEVPLYQIVHNKTPPRLSASITFKIMNQSKYALGFWNYSQLCLGRILISRIIAKVEGLFKSSSLYILLFLTLISRIFSKSMLFLQSQQIRLRQSWLYNVLLIIYILPIPPFDLVQ